MYKKQWTKTTEEEGPVFAVTPADGKNFGCL